MHFQTLILIFIGEYQFIVFVIHFEIVCEVAKKYLTNTSDRANQIYLTYNPKKAKLMPMCNYLKFNSEFVISSVLFPIFGNFGR